MLAVAPAGATRTCTYSYVQLSDGSSATLHVFLAFWLYAHFLP